MKPGGSIQFRTPSLVWQSTRNWIKRTLLVSVLASTIIGAAPGQTHLQPESTPPFVAGFRSSRILSNYPNRQFPSPDYWISAAQRMSGKFSGSAPAGIWIVSLYQSNGVTQMNFPGDGGLYPFIQFISSDQNEAFLSQFDSVGISVWLQVEPGAASMDTLISLVLGRYKKHVCVKGFGVDVEWYNTNTSAGGRKLTDNEARAWEAKVKSIDSSYTLFLKHYAPSWMPPSYRGNILFVDDSQDFPSLNSMVSEFKAWGGRFAPNSVAFQFGYPIDTTWWRQYADPASSIGNALRSAVPNCSGLFWVDFTIMTVFPLTAVQDLAGGPVNFELMQSYPNPFNPTTAISYMLVANSFVTLKLYDLLGREVATLVDGRMEAGLHTATWNASGFPSGVYFYRLQTGQFVQTRKSVLQK